LKLERKEIWLVGWWKTKGRSKEFTVMSAFSTEREAKEKQEWYEKTFTNREETYEIQKVKSWFPSQF
jgi:hypothetical protein